MFLSNTKSYSDPFRRLRAAAALAGDRSAAARLQLFQKLERPLDQ
jgi:hypothetical protein